MSGPWLTIKEAAYLMGYTPDHFRRTFCNPENPLLTIRERFYGSRGGRRILVLQVEVEALVESEIRRPA